MRARSGFPAESGRMLGVKNGIHYFQTGMNNPKDIPQAPVNHGRNGSGMPSAPAINALDFIHSMATS